jgi:hypothetical protein
MHDALLLLIYSPIMSASPIRQTVVCLVLAPAAMMSSVLGTRKFATWSAVQAVQV